MDILNIARAIKKMSVTEIRDFISENYYKQYSMERLGKKRFILYLQTN